MKNNPEPIKRISATSVYHDQYVTVFRDEVVGTNGVPGRYLRIVESGGNAGAAMLAIAAGHIALVQTFRYAVGTWEWGIPRGFAQGDDVRSTACAELNEELGREPDELIEIGLITPNSGLLASVVHLFFARYAVQTSQPKCDEILNVRWVPIAELLREISSGHITDGFTLAAVACGWSHGLL